MQWPNCAEMAAIESKDEVDAEPFGKRDHGCVCPAQRQGAVLFDHLGDTSIL